ncbi:MAG: SIS domain-containing protein [Selenomonadaceae bacterium]|nr:SIS domain-containing protein [Selenomonadaceae bacterium]
MKKGTVAKIEDVIKRYPALEICREQIFASVEILCEGFGNGGKLITCGNGGSAADAMHIVGELMKSFLLPRKIDDCKPEFLARANEMFPSDVEYFKANLQGALPAISLVGETSLLTAFANDVTPNLIFAQQVFGIGRRGDVFLAISTSGNSDNVLFAVEVAKIMGLKVIAMTGRRGGRLRHLSDAAICVPADSAYSIQEFHLPIYHMMCMAVEYEFFGEE